LPLGKKYDTRKEKKIKCQRIKVGKTKYKGESNVLRVKQMQKGKKLTPKGCGRSIF
jgi:hypothetical protein